jgi:hypothetical protein
LLENNADKHFENLRQKMAGLIGDKKNIKSKKEKMLNFAKRCQKCWQDYLAEAKEVSE